MKKIISLVLAIVLFSSFLPFATLVYAETIVVGTSDSGYSETGSWAPSGLPGYNGDATRFGGTSAKWTPKLQKGRYRVSFFNVAYVGDGTDYKLEIYHADGKSEKVVNNENEPTDLIDLGVYNFNDGENGYVVLSKGAGTKALRTSAVIFEREEGSASAEQSIVSYQDIEENMTTPVGLVTALGILPTYDGNEFEPQKAFTRAEFVTHILNYLGVHPLEGTSKFNDVPAELAGIILPAIKLGIINGYDDNTFRPNDKITILQATKMIIVATGYSMFAEENGGWPTGYLTESLNSGLLRGIKMSNDEELTRGSAAIMLYNMLFMDQLAYHGNFEDHNFTKVKTGDNILKERYNVEKIKGIVSENSRTALSSEVGCREGYVVLNGERIALGGSKADEWLGQRITAFVLSDKSGNNDSRIIYAEQSADNIIYNIDYFQINKVEDVNKGYRYTVFDGDETVKYEVSATADYLYNGLYAPADSVPKNPKQGYIEMIDNNNDGVIDVLKISDYETYIAELVTKDTEIAYDKYSNTSLDLSYSDKKSVKIYKNGNVIKPGAIREWDILSVERALDTARTVTNLYISDTKVSGVLEEINEDKYIINGKEYEVLDSYYAAVEANKAERIYIGDSADFLLDIKGRIAAIKTSNETGKKYAYLHSYSIEKGLDKRITFRLFTYNGEWLDIVAAGKINYNGESVSFDKLLNKAELFTGNILKNQIIIYDVNSVGDLCEITTASLNAGIGGFNGAYDQPSQPLRNNYSMEGVVFLSTQTKVFIIPDDLNRRQEFAISNRSYFPTETTVSFKYYDVNEFGTIGAIEYSLQLNNASVVNRVRNKHLTLIEKVTQGLENDIIYGYSDGKAERYILSDNLSSDDITTGDIYQFEKNKDNVIIGMSSIFKMRNIGELSALTTIGGGEKVIFKGNIVKTSNSEKRCVVNDGKNFFADVSGSRVYIYNATTNKISVANILDFQPDDYVVMRVRYAGVADAIIYRR